MERELAPRERRDWLRLSLSENVGPVTFKSLIQRYGDAAAAIAALPELSRSGGLSRPLRLYGVDQAEADLARADDLGISAVVPGERDYPTLLRHIPAAPPVLWIKGRLELAERTCVAIVGSRSASAIGLKFTRQLATEIGREGHAIASGLARGIDTAAHEATLATGTIAVLAGGLDVIYPPENAGLHQAIAEQGLLISEMKPGTVPKAEHFPRRNRLISGIARAVVVVEAAIRSGSLITARLAGEQGRDVFAVPGSPLDPRAEGTNKLIREGATLLTSARDVLDTLSGSFTPHLAQFMESDGEPLPHSADIDGSERRQFIDLLSPSPIEVDDLVRESGLPASTVTALLLELELAGRVARHPQGTVSLT